VPTCQYAFEGCVCLPTIDTPGFSCGNQAPCGNNQCDGAVVNGVAVCQNAFAGCECWASINTPGFFCGNPQSCENGNCGGTVDISNPLLATCKRNYAGCTCIPDYRTPGYCTTLGSCNLCNGVPNAHFGKCTTGRYNGCPCYLQPATATKPLGCLTIPGCAGGPPPTNIPTSPCDCGCYNRCLAYCFLGEEATDQSCEAECHQECLGCNDKGPTAC
jgi:hypothetical protein